MAKVEFDLGEKSFTLYLDIEETRLFIAELLGQSAANGKAKDEGKPVSNRAAGKQKSNKGKGPKSRIDLPKYKIIQDYVYGKPVVKIAEEHGVSDPVVHSRLKEWGAKEKKKALDAENGDLNELLAKVPDGSEDREFWESLRE